MVEGVRIFVVRWELLWNGIQLDCPNPECRCKGIGKLIHMRYPFLKHGGSAVLLLNLDTANPVDWLVPMK